MGHGHIPIKILLDHGISTSINISKSYVARLVSNMLMENLEKLLSFSFFCFYSTSFGGSYLDYIFDIFFLLGFLNLAHEILDCYYLEAWQYKNYACITEMVMVRGQS